MTTTRIEFAPGHEDEAITEQDVAAKVLKMKAAGQMYEALLGCIEHMEWSTPSGALALNQARRAIAAAEGRSLLKARNA